MLAHTAYREAEVAVADMFGEKDEMHYRAIPAVVYSNPELAMAGMTADAARAAGIAYREEKLPMAYAGRFVAENEGGSGMCKIVVEEGTEKLLGAHILGNPASEIIFGACMAIGQGMTVREFRQVVFPHPTVSEIIRETLFRF